MPISLLSLPALVVPVLASAGAVPMPTVGSRPTPSFALEQSLESGNQLSHLTGPRVSTPERPMLQMIRPPAPSEATDLRIHGRDGRLGDLAWSIASERRRSRSDGMGDKRAALHRTLDADATLAFDLSPADSVIARATLEMDKRADILTRGDQSFAKTRSLGAGIGWSHGGRWRLDLAWRDTSAQARSPMARLVDLASGAPRAERQTRLQLSLAPVKIGQGAMLTLGAQASVGRLNGYDRALSGPGARRDNGASVFARFAF